MTVCKTINRPVLMGVRPGHCERLNNTYPGTRNMSKSRWTNISQKNREARLRWLGHVERKADGDVVISKAIRFDRYIVSSSNCT